MKYLFDTDAISIFYDAARMPEHLQLKNRVSALKDEDVLQGFCPDIVRVRVQLLEC